jgi:SAM-dependent methyltransferase
MRSGDAQAEESRKQPSRLVQTFAPKMAEASGGRPILDVACGSGRNARPFFRLGCTVICVDRDLSRLQGRKLSDFHDLSAAESPRLTFRQMDLVNDIWPFGVSSVGGIINIHFFLPRLLSDFESSLSPGGYLLLETVPGCGGNYLELPKAGFVRAHLEETFDFECYEETKVGPSDYDAVTVRLLARRRSR